MKGETMDSKVAAAVNERTEPTNKQPLECIAPVSLRETIGTVPLSILRRQCKVLLPLTATAYALIFIVNWATINENLLAEYDTCKLYRAFVYCSIMIIADAAIVRAVAESYIGRAPTIWGSLTNALKRIHILWCSGSMIGIVLVIIAMVDTGLFEWAGYWTMWQMYDTADILIMFIVGLTMRVIMTFVFHTIPATIVENQGPIDSIKRSVSLSTGHRMYIFLAILCVYAIKVSTISFFALFGYSSEVGPEAHLEFDHDSDPIFYTVVIDDDQGGESSYYRYSLTARRVVSKSGIKYYLVLVSLSVLNILIACYNSVVQVVAYTNVRAKKEGLTVEMLSRAGLGIYISI